MILHKENTKTNADSTNESNSLMLKMVTSYSIFLLIILILFFGLYHSTFHNMRILYNLQNKSTLVSNVELFENDLDIMEVYCRQLLQSDDFRKVMNYQNTYHPFTDMGNEVRISLATNVFAESLLPITENFIYLPLTDYILNPSYFITEDRFYQWIKKYPAGEEALWMEYLTNEDYFYRFLPMDAFTPNYSRSYFMYVIDLGDLFYLDANGVVCFILESSELAAMFDCLQFDNAGFLTVLDQEGRELLQLGNGAVLSSGDIASLDFSEGFASRQSGMEGITIGTYTSDKTGYTYYYGFPSFDTTSNTWPQRIFFFLIFALAHVMGGLLVFFFSRRNVRPIIELGQELHEAVEAQNQLQEVVDRQRPIICTSYVRRLMSGSITSTEEVSYIADYLGLKEDSFYYNVLHVVVYNNFGDSSDTLPEGLDTPQQLQEIIGEALKKYLGMPLYYFSPTDRTYSVLLHCSASEEKDFPIKISSVVLNLHNYLLDTYDIWLFAGMGRNTDSLINVWESYQQAVESVSYTTKNYIFFPYEFIKKNSNAYYYPPEISTKLIHFITAGNTSQVLELLNLIHQENIEERSLPMNLLKYLLSDIRNTLLKARFALPAGVDPEAVRLLDERFNERLSFKLCEDLALTLCRLFSNESEDTNLASTIEKYIAKNYKDPSLGLNKIADEFQISESYFSHMFKEKTGVNFSTYLENIRMTEAARLIRETDVSLNELYIAVGYNNVNTFRRAFKKVFGVTPSSMRDSTK